MQHNVTGGTTAFGLIGYPLGHSWSKEHFEKKFARLGLKNFRYDLFPCQSAEELPAILEAHPELRGLNVTIPHKQAVIPYLNSLSDTARAIGAVNTILIEHQAGHAVLHGDNTDAWGFAESLRKYGISPGRAGETALVLGTGGASQAVTWVLRQTGWSVIRVTRCHDAHEHSASDRHNNPGHAPAPGKLHAGNGPSLLRDLLFYDELGPDVLAACRLIVNTTPLGMYPNIHSQPPIPYQYLNNSHILYDLVYNPPRTRFLDMGQAAGSTIIGGLDMLVLQADKSWEIWTK